MPVPLFKDNINNNNKSKIEKQWMMKKSSK
jgi:hypothetical protein